MFSVREGYFVNNTLMPGRRIVFVLDPRVMSVMRSRVASCSPEHYWLALTTGGNEFLRVPGNLVGAFIESEP